MNADHLPKIFITQDEVNYEEESNMSLCQLLDHGGEKNLHKKRPGEEDGDERDDIASQMNENNYKLGSLLRDGNELVSNVIVANDRREVTRRMKEAELREELLHILQAESAVAMTKFNQISRNWAELDEVKDPFNMNLGLEQQKFRIAALMKQKDDIIAECREEVEKAEESYYVDQEEHSEDLKCLCDRINAHIETMKKVYGSQLYELQGTIDQERQRIKRESNEAWNDIFAKRSDQEQFKLEQQKVTLNHRDSELDKLVLEHEELIRATKVRLEKDNECLQIELQKTKSNVLLNTQKLDYNFEVLKRREEENILVRNQQKKRLTKLYDTVTFLRKTIRETSTKSSLDINKLRRNDIPKLKNQIAEMESSANLIAEANDLKYKKVWEMNQEECINLLKEIRQLDADLSENELGIASLAKPEHFLDIADLPSFKKAMEMLTIEKSTGTSQYDDTMVLADEGLRSLFGQIVDTTGFIIEDKLKEILEPLQEADSKLIKLSTFLNIFNIKEDKDLDLLIGVFRKYIRCSNCTSLLEQGCQKHCWLVESEDILPALYEIRLQLQRTPRHCNMELNCSEDTKSTFSRLMDPKEVDDFWKQFEGIYSKDKEQLWTGLQYGLNQYLTVLRERECLFGDCEQLRKQNEELLRLLHNHK